MKKNLLILELNEADFDFFLYGAKKYNFLSIKNFLSGRKKMNTFTKDKNEGYNLDPWVQWISVHTGIPSKKHKVFRLGQKLDKSKKQIWDVLSKKKINSTVWGAFNSILNLKKNIDVFFPDPWSFKEEAFPKKFNSFLKLPRYYAKNYPSINNFKVILYGLFFFYKIIFSSIILYFVKFFFPLFKIFWLSKLKSFNLYFFLDLISLLILKKNLKKTKSKLAIIAINSFAHYQHNYWDTKKYEYVYFWYLNEMVKIICDIEKYYNSTIILNGFSQKKIKNEYHLRAKEPMSFLKKINLSYQNIEPNMTTGSIVSFKTLKDKMKAIKKIKDIYLYSYPLFEIQDFRNEKKFFYKFSLVSLKNKYHYKSLKKNNYKIFFKRPKKIIKKNNIKKDQRILLDYIFKNSVFIKSTSRHVSNGSLFYKNIKIPKILIDTGCKLENIKIFRIILNHFK